jgi:hypothetical protein
MEDNYSALIVAALVVDNVPFNIHQTKSMLNSALI